MSKRRLTQNQKRRIAQNQSQNFDTDQAIEGVVITHYGKEVVVEAKNQQHTCKLRQNLGDLTCGDKVSFIPQQGNEHGVVLAIDARINLLRKTGFAGKAKPVAANIDQVIIVCAVSPEPNQYLIDRYIVAAENLPASPVLVLNKIDLLEPNGSGQNNGEIEQHLRKTYEDTGIEIIGCSAKYDRHLDTLRELLDNRISILVGLSGVGKTSLVNQIIPDVKARIGEVSAASNEGTHTTTVSTLYHIPSGGHLIDSPGVRDFTPVIENKQQVLNGFTELRKHFGECKFNDCTHSSEPGCAVLAAIENNEINAERLASYQHMLKDLETI